jgi:hypothetical protein
MPNDHMLRAFRTANEKAPENKMLVDLTEGDIPEAIRKHLSVTAIARHYAKTIDNRRRTLEEARPYIDAQTWSIVSRASVLPCTDLPDSVIVTNAEGYEGGVIVNATLQPSWKYEYNAMTLASKLLDDFEQQIEEVHRSYQSTIEAIAAIVKIAEKLERSDVNGLLDLHIHHPRPCTFESDRRHVAGQMAHKNRQAARKSDIALRFDESYFDYDALSFVNHGVPAYGVLNERMRMYYGSLSSRTSLRRAITNFMRGGRAVVINGVTYQKKEGDHYVTDGSSSQEIANLLGIPVRKRWRRRVIEPEQWALDEIRLVNAYLNDEEGAAHALTEVYDFSECSMTGSEEITRQLDLSLKPRAPFFLQVRRWFSILDSNPRIEPSPMLLIYLMT